ncbi:WD40 repeat domain-containing protein [Sphaerisporangium corydalis]|uniref:WD40 repeat domain-containing protein n=1 Tax=Sphaerisporangium corydalis TaxID=1441875 RepID=A0ABV9EVC6_9ACTN|nr:WD40 repeat domain-containing protein [Sphaerisporangium corydalis]
MIVLLVVISAAFGGYLFGSTKYQRKLDAARPPSVPLSSPSRSASGSPAILGSSVHRLATLDPNHPKIFDAISISGTLAEWQIGRSRVPLRSGNPGEVSTVRALAIDKMTLNTLATGLGDGGLQIWDATDLSKPVREVSGQGAVTAVAFDPTAKNTLVVGRENGALEVWDSAKLRLSSAVGVTGHGALTALALDATTPNTLVSASIDGTVQIWDRTKLDKPLLATRIKGHGQITALALDPQVKNSFAIGFVDGAVQIRDRVKPELLKQSSSGGHASSVLALSFDDKLLTAVLADGSVEVWEAAILGPVTQTFDP